MTQQPKRPIVNLDLLATKAAGEVELFGRIHEVRQLDGAHYHVAQQLTRGDIDILAQYELAAWCVPTLTPDEVGQLVAEQVGAIVAIADGRIREIAQAIQEADPNGERPAGESPPA